MFPEPTGLLLIGNSIESIWTPRSKSNILTPKTNLPTFWPRGNFTRDEWNHLLCLFNIRHFQFYRVFWSDVEKNAKKTQVKKESQQSRKRWWIWSRDAAKRLLMFLPLQHRKAWGKPDTKINLLWARKMSSIIERRDPLYTRSHQAVQNGTSIRLGLLKSRNLMNWWKIQQSDLLYSPSTRTDSLEKR